MPPSALEILLAQKAMAFDLQKILEQNKDKTYTVEELKALINAYIEGAEQRWPTDSGPGKTGPK